MRTIAHISGLRFGDEDPHAQGALLRDLAELGPALVAVSGDLTQRARIREFARARDFLVRVPAPLLVVPGDRDVPLFDVVRRLARPLARYRAYVTSDLQPVYSDDELLVVGVCTAGPLAWRGGRVSWEQLERVRSLASSPGPERLRVLVAHRPFPPSDLSPQGQAVGAAAAALAALGGCGIDVVLTGDLRRGAAVRRSLRGHTLARRVLAVHAGSAISRSLRREPNTYDLLRVRGHHLEVELRAFTGERFEPVRESRFTRTAAGWVPLAPLEAPAPPGTASPP